MFVFSALPKLQPGKWTAWPVGGAPPVGRWGATTVFTLDGRLVVYGGERDIPGSDGATLGDLHVFHAGLCSVRYATPKHHSTSLNAEAPFHLTQRLNAI